MGKVYIWAAILALTYNDGKIDFDVRRDVFNPATAAPRAALKELYRNVGLTRLEKAFDGRL